MTQTPVQLADTHAPHDELWDLENLRNAQRLCNWMYEQFSQFVKGNVAEVGAGIGTFSERLLANLDIETLLLIEPESACVDMLSHTFSSDSRVSIACETLPDSPALRSRAGEIDFLLCQNVLEHIADDGAAVQAMANSLRPGGHLTLLVPAHPRLYGNLDRLYGHHRRYTRERLRHIAAKAGLGIDDLYSFNLLGVPGWWLTGFRDSPKISSASLRVYETLLRIWQPVERLQRPPLGLSLVAHLQKPTG